ncbi:MAG: hotdog fold thioesterase [Caldilineaceae bacterium]|nr:hotdog fold thioesterase [Caldilineaceae bacterium]MCB9136845.1 hotdog fold thioesterase [Caldilineaceae bacterium]
MSIWFYEAPSLDAINAFAANTMLEHLGIEVTAIDEDSITGIMPVDHRTVQPMGILHGGASVALAESLGSYAATLCVDPARYTCVGLEINANHIRSVRTGTVTGTARPIHVGRRTQVWEIRIEDGDGRLVCVSRLTLAVIERSDG